MKKITITSYPLHGELVTPSPTLLDCFQGMSSNQNFTLYVDWMFHQGSLQVVIWDANERASNSIIAYLNMNKYFFVESESERVVPNGTYRYSMIPIRTDIEEPELLPHQLFATLSYLKRSGGMLTIKLCKSRTALTFSAECNAANDTKPWEILSAYDFNPNKMNAPTNDIAIENNLGRKLMALPVAYDNFKNLIYGYGNNSVVPSALDGMRPEEKPIIVGSILNNPINEILTLTPKDFSYMTAVWGVPGQGKTVLSLSMIIQLWKQHHIPSLIIEPSKHEYRALANFFPKDVRVINDMSRFNILIPPKGVDKFAWSEVIMTLINMACQLPEDSSLLGYFRNAYLCTPEPLTPRNMLLTYQAIMKNEGFTGNQSKDFVQAGLSRLQAFFIYFNGNTKNWNLPANELALIPFNVEELLRSPVVIELANIPTPKVKSAWVYFILQHLYAHIQQRPSQSDSLKNLLVLEEAHNILRKTSSEEVLANVANILAEARALQLGVVISDQSPKSLDPSCTAMAQNVFSFKIVDQEDREIIANSTAGDQDKLIAIPKHTCMVRTNFMKEPDNVAVTSEFSKEIEKRPDNINYL